MSALVATLRRRGSTLRRSMTAQISLSITLVSVLVIAVFGTWIEQSLASELREENERLLLANLAFIRDDLAASDYDLSIAARLVDRTERRVHWLHAAILDAEGSVVIARSPNYSLPITALPRQLLDAAVLPTDVTMNEVDGLRERLGRLTSISVAPDGTRYRMLLGRVAIPARATRPGASVLVALAVEPTQTRELRSRDRRSLAVAVSVAALIAGALGIAIARRIVVSARRLGTASSRIGAKALNERLSLDETPIELVESTIAFNGMLDRLQNAFERLSAFSSDIAHDLRTPITTLLGEAQVALSQPRSADEYRAVLESSVEEYERLSRGIGNMLFLAHVDNDQAALDACWLDLRMVLDRVAGYFELLADEKKIRLHVSFDTPRDALPRAWASETLLIRALSNLVSNALRHAETQTSIDLSVKLDTDGGCVIEVSNQGPKIGAEHVAHIFERFYRAEPSRHDSASGSGLGLAIVRSIMTMHRGTVSVRRAPVERTVFSLHFPPPASSRVSPAQRSEAP